MPSPRADLALDANRVLELAGAAVAAATGWEPATCAIELVKRSDRRIVARYEFRYGDRALVAAGKWFANERGELVRDVLDALRTHVAVPAVIGSFPSVQALFVEWVDGSLLRDVVDSATGPQTAREAGAWLARFHDSGLSSPRQCGPDKQRKSVERWAREQPALRAVEPLVDAALASCPDPGRPVHYDYYHQQIIVTPERTIVVVDLDEAGLGDPAFDAAHFLAHLERLALHRTGDPDTFAASAVAFRDGYSSTGLGFSVAPALRAFAWYKLLWQALARDDTAVIDYARDAIGRALAEQ